MKRNLQNTSAQSLLEEADSLHKKNKINEALALLDHIQLSSSSDTDLLLWAKLTNLRGLIYITKADYNNAESAFLESLEFSKKIGDTRLVYNRYDNLAAVYSALKDYKSSIDYLQRSIELKDSIGNQKDQSRGYIQLSSLFFDIDNTAAGKEALRKSQALIQKFKQRELLMHWHYAMGMNYKREGNYKSALAEYTKSIRLSEEFRDHTISAKAYSNQGDILMHQHRWKESEQKYISSLKIAKKHFLTHVELSVSLQLAAIALEKKDLGWSRTLFEFVNRQSKDHNNPILQRDLAELSARLNKAEGNYKDALDSYEIYHEHYKKVYNNELSRTILGIRAKYENEKKERELEKAKLRQVESELKTLRAERALLTSEKRFRALIENGTDIIYIIDQKLNPTYASPAAFHALGYKENEPWNKNILGLLHPEDIETIFSKIKIAMKAPGIPIFGQLRLPKKNGDYIWVEGTATNLFHVDGAHGIVCNLRDITERKQAEAAIKELNESLERKITERTSELKEANKGLESFSYSVSHDLRSPLRVINGYSALLAKKYGNTMNEEAQIFIKSIKDNANHMGHLIDDLLNLSRLGRQELSKTQVEMHQIVSDTIEELLTTEGTTDQTSITIKSIKDARADPGLVRQVWINVISNAIKYSKKKSKPRIEIGTIAKGKELIYYVKDNGAGFDMIHSDKLFGAFQRLHDKSDFEGTGVGLAIVHQIIAKHGGRIWAESKVDKGATFYFTFGE